jgi:phage shock protein PspC (stress-responsive transcriptional regulator)
MSLSDDLDRLADLHRRGVLTDDEFARAKARTIDTSGPSAAGPAPSPSAARSALSPAIDTINGLQRSLTDRWISGVCGGIAKSLGLASWIVRVVFVLMVLCAGTGVLLYALLWLFVPEETLRIGYTPNPPRNA